MATDGHTHDHSALREYLGVLRRRKWIALAAIVLVPAAAFTFSHFQEAKYRASAEVLLSNQNISQQITGVTPASGQSTPDRVAQTQANLARVPLVAQRTLRAAGVHNRTAADLLRESSVQTQTNSDLLTFTVTDRDPSLASRLATQYARQYTAYRRQLDTGAIQRALTEVNSKISQLGGSGSSTGALYASLIEKQQTLETMLALQTSNAFVVRTAGSAGQVQPRPAHNAALGLLLGIVLGLGLAFLREALDTRVRSADDVAQQFGVPLLARVPAPPRELRAEDRLVMLSEPRSAKAEPFRVLRTNLEFVNIEHKAQTIVVTSALEGEGKSTTAANLAVALARAGKHVVLVDLDLRRPYLDRYFGILGRLRPNLVGVALGQIPLEDALVRIPLSERSAEDQAENGAGGILEVLAAGPMPPNPGEFSGSPIVADILDSLARRAPFVIIDTAPLLGVGDTLALSNAVHAMVLVTRLNLLRKPMLREVHRLLEAAPVNVLGFVVTDAEVEDQYGYGYGYGYHYGYGHQRDRKVHNITRASTARD
jgi:succinoglycan biosynthesis transport protein ExoP